MLHPSYKPACSDRAGICPGRLGAPADLASTPCCASDTGPGQISSGKAGKDDLVCVSGGMTDGGLRQRLSMLYTAVIIVSERRRHRRTCHLRSRNKDTRLFRGQAVTERNPRQA